MAEASPFPCITNCSYVLYHAPYFTGAYGTSLEAVPADSLAPHLRAFANAAAYPPNLAYIGGIDPRSMPERPWYGAADAGSAKTAGVSGEGPVRSGPFGAIVDEAVLYGLIALADSFDLVELEESFAREAADLLRADPVLSGKKLASLDKGKTREQIEKQIGEGALPLKREGKLVGCVKQAHPTDVNLSAHTILENMSAKATGAYAALRLLYESGTGPEEIEYIIETSEEACGDINQRGGGNFAKAIGEVAGLTRATGSDVRSFCAAPVHGLLQAASLTASGTFSKVMVVAGGTTAKLGMNGKKHIEKGLPILEDCMGAFAVIVSRGAFDGLRVRTDAVGRHRIGTGASPQAVIGDLVSEPLYRAGLTICDVDYFAPELQNPEITENAGAGNVTEANLKMIAALAVMNKEIERGEIPSFIESRGFTGWAPTQGHIPSGIPALGWFLKWGKEGLLRRCMVVGKGSLFLGRMTNLFDGVSLLLEYSGTGKAAEKAVESAAGTKKSAGSDRRKAAFDGILGGVGLVSAEDTAVIGLTIPGSESGAEELYRGAEAAAGMSEQSGAGHLRVRYFGDAESDPKQAHAEMERALESGEIHGAVTFHYPFPVGAATVGRINVPGTEREIFLATTTGTASTDRVSALVRNALSGAAAAEACGIADPKIGILNLEGSAAAYKKLSKLKNNGFDINLVSSVRNETLLRGNDILSGGCDVIVCDSLTGNALMKVLAAYSTGGKTETTGSGYGPGLGPIRLPGIINIISRATAAPVIANAILYTEKLIRGRVADRFRELHESAEAAGLAEILSAAATEAAGPKAGGTAVQGVAGGGGASRPEKKAVDTEIEGLDVLEVDAAVAMLGGKGIYAEAGMGCSGPVIMVAGEDKQTAAELLSRGGYL